MNKEDLIDLQIFTLDLDTPTVCPHCGNRTEFRELENNQQLHTCKLCAFDFIGEFDE